jgi:mRNA-degrading endonuclease RelE of RelBE toxin-antitoxin system
LSLERQPRGPNAKQILPGVLRLRAGDWRIFYGIDDAKRVVMISRILRRNERTYRDF